MTQKFHFAILRIEVIRASRGFSAIAELPVYLLKPHTLCKKTGISFFLFLHLWQAT